MYPVPESLSDSFKKVVYTKECGLCRICGRPCRDRVYRIVSDVPYSRDNQSNLELFYLQHVGCKEADTGKPEKSLLQRHFSLYILFISLALIIYGGYLFAIYKNPFGIVGGVTLAVIAKFVWKAEIDLENSPRSLDSIRSIDDIDQGKYVSYSKLEQVKDFIAKNSFRIIGLLLFIVLALVVIFGVFFVFTYLVKNASFFFK